MSSYNNKSISKGAKGRNFEKKALDEYVFASKNLKQIDVDESFINAENCLKEKDFDGAQSNSIIYISSASAVIKNGGPESPNSQEMAIKLIHICYILISLVSNTTFFEPNFDKLKEALQESIKLIKIVLPRNCNLPTIKGFWCFYTEEYKDSKKYFLKALGFKKNFPLALLGMGHLLYYTENFRMATKYLQKFLIVQRTFNINIPLDMLDARMTLALSLYRLRAMRKSYKVLRGIIKESPENIEAAAIYSLFLLNDYKERPYRPDIPQLGSRFEPLPELYEVCHKAYERDPNHQLINLVLGDYYYYAKDFEKAMFHAKKAYTVENPISANSCAEASLIIGKIFMALSMYEDAEKHFKLSLYHNSMNPTANLGLALTCLYKNDFFQASRILEKILVHQSKRIFPHWIQADLNITLLFLSLVSHIKRNRLAPVGFAFNDVLFQHLVKFTQEEKTKIIESPDQLLRDNAFNTFISLAKYFHNGRWNSYVVPALKTANEFAAASIKHNPNYSFEIIKVLNNMGSQNLFDKKHLDACSDFWEALEYIKDIQCEETRKLWVTVSYNLSLALEATERKEDAKRLLLKIIQEFPTYYDAHLHLALMIKNEEIEQTKLILSKVYESTIKLDIPNAKESCIEALLHLGHIYTDAKNYKVARYYYKLILAEVDPNHFYALCAVGYNYLSIARVCDDRKERKELYKKAATYFRSAHSIERSNPFPIAGIGCILADRHNYDHALRIFKEISADYDSINLRRNLGNLYYKVGLFKNGIMEFKAVMEKFGKKNYIILQCKARVHYMFGIKEKNEKELFAAIQILKEAINSYPYEPTLHFDYCLAIQGYCQVLCEKNSKKISVKEVNDAKDLLHDSELLFEDLIRIGNESRQVYSLKTCINRLGFSKSIHASLDAFKEKVDRDYVAPKPYKVNTYGLDLGDCLEAFGIRDPNLDMTPEQEEEYNQKLMEHNKKTTNVLSRYHIIPPKDTFRITKVGVTKQTEKRRLQRLAEQKALKDQGQEQVQEVTENGNQETHNESKDELSNDNHNEGITEENTNLSSSAIQDSNQLSSIRESNNLDLSSVVDSHLATKTSDQDQLESSNLPLKQPEVDTYELVEKVENQKDNETIKSPKRTTDDVSNIQSQEGISDEEELRKIKKARNDQNKIASDEE